MKSVLNRVKDKVGVGKGNTCLTGKATLLFYGGNMHFVVVEYIPHIAFIS